MAIALKSKSKEQAAIVPDGTGSGGSLIENWFAKQPHAKGNSEQYDQEDCVRRAEIKNHKGDRPLWLSR